MFPTPQDYYGYVAQQRINSILGQTPQTQPGNIGINWVSGPDEVKAFKLPPRANAIFLDSENNGIFYIKIADELGFSKIRMFRYQEVEPVSDAPKDDPSQFIRKDELPALILELLAKKRDESNEQPVQ